MTAPGTPWPRAVQFAVVVVVCAVVVLATPTGLFLRHHVPSQVRGLFRLVPAEGGMEERRLRTLGGDYRFFALVREGTPEDAVILMSDPDGPSMLDRKKGKHQGWVSHVLYPRTVLYLHQDEDPRYRDARYLVVDGEAAVYWLPEDRRPPTADTPGLIPFDMGAYLAAVDRGEIDARYRPPTSPLRRVKR